MEGHGGGEPGGAMVRHGAGGSVVLCPFCPECQGTGVRTGEEELERPKYPLAQVLGFACLRKRGDGPVERAEILGREGTQTEDRDVVGIGFMVDHATLDYFGIVWNTLEKLGSTFPIFGSEV